MPAFPQSYQPTGDYAFLSSKRIFHLVGDDRPLQAADLDLPATQRRIFVRPAASHPIKVAESERAYAEGRFSDAADTVAKLAALTLPNPSVLDCYARGPCTTRPTPETKVTPCTDGSSPCLIDTVRKGPK